MKTARAKARLAALARSAAVVTLHIEGDVDETMAHRVSTALSAAPTAKTINIHVNSPGGDLRSAFLAYDSIRAHSAAQKRAYGYGDVASAAALIFLAADVRRLYPSARVLLHGAELPNRDPERWTRAAYAEAIDTLALLDESVRDIIVERTGARPEIIAAEMANEKAMPPPKALSIGFAHEIVGQSQPLDPSWPAHAQACMRHNISAALGYRYSPTYLSACRLAGQT
jgi:ATP-dependent protease ClpP protease subunit